MNSISRILFVFLMLLAAAPARAGLDSFALQFDGLGDVVSAVDYGDLRSGQLTVTAWVKTTMTNGLAGLIMKNSVDENDGWQVFLAQGVLRAWYYAANDRFVGGVDGLHGGRIADGAWHHIAFVVDERGGRLLVDGALRAAGSWTGAPGAVRNHGDLVLGIGVGVGLYRGAMDEVAVWDRAFTGTEIAAMRSMSLSGREPQLRYYYRFSEGQGSRADNSVAGKGSFQGQVIGSQTWVPGVLLGPAVATLPADAITSRSARLRGEVSCGGTNTTAWFEWGSTTNYGQATAIQPVGSRDRSVLIAVVLPGLTADVPVHYRLVASNIFGVAYGSNVTVVPPASNLTQERSDHTATLLPNGKVLVAGGRGAPFNQVGFPTNTAELFDPATGRWTPTGSMRNPHGLHSATLLLNGRVLVLDVFGAELYDPSTGTWSSTGQPRASHNVHTATLLPDGRVLVAGGLGNSPEIYNPVTGQWTLTGALNTPRSRHTATLLPNGKVLVAGGEGTDQNALASAELYDPSTGQWNFTGTMRNARRAHTATLQINGRVLAVGGMDGTSILRTAERYDFETGSWTLVTGLLTARRHYHTATLLPNGLVLVLGGDADASGTAEFIEPSGEVWQPAPSLATRRFSPTATLLMSGRILLCGGTDRDGVSLASQEIYIPQLPAWSVTTPMSADRNGHTATLLPNGRVLVAGYGPAELFHFEDNVWSNAPALNVARSAHTATLLAGGQVLVAGGYDGSFSVIGDAELYDHAANSWAKTGSLKANRYGHTATLLADGRVLVAGGVETLLGGALDSVELFRPATGSWSNAAPMLARRSGHTASLLPGGQVLVAGGGPDNFTVTASAEIFDPGTGLWTATGPMTTNRVGHRAVLLPNGTVLVAGGVTGAFLLGTETAETYDPATGDWTSTTPMTVGRANASATLLPDGQVLMAGGFGQGYLDSGEIYDPATRTWLFSITMDTATASHTATLLPDGKVLIAGGFNHGGATNRAELFHADHGALPAAQPEISQCSSALASGDRLQVSGVRLRGVSGASFGSQKESASDVPVVQLRALESGRTLSLLSTNWSTNAYTSLPLGDFPSGWAMVTVWVNGSPSAARLIEVLPLFRPTLTVQRVSATSTRIVWPSASAGFRLQENSDFNSSNWINASPTANDDGTNKSITVNPSAARRFYRLVKP